MTRCVNLILTGRLHCGKSTLVRRMLRQLAVDFMGVLCEPILCEKMVVGYGLRMVERAGLHVFAHVDIDSTRRFGKYGVDLAPFDRAADYILSCLPRRPRLFVIDEIGAIESAASNYKSAVNGLLDSNIATLIVVQKRADYMQEIRKRHDVMLFDLDDHPLGEPMLTLLKEITNANGCVDAERGCRDEVQHRHNLDE